MDRIRGSGGIRARLRSRGPRRAGRLASTVYCLALLPMPGAAQTVNGEVMERETGEALGGAFVVLVDTAGQAAASALTDSAGRFLLEAPAAGDYRLRTERVGFTPVTSPPVAVPAAGLDHRFEVGSEPVGLDGLAAEARRDRCRMPEEGSGLGVAWQQARVALAVAVWAERTRHVAGEAVAYERVIDPLDMRVLHEAVRWLVTLDGGALALEPVSELAADGFVRPDGEGFVFRRLDPETLLSDAFLAGHCLRLRAPGRDEPGLIGVAFQPARGAPGHGVRGVLWLDAAAAELRSLEYTFAWMPWLLPAEPFGGEAGFRRLPDGAWIVERWAFREPRVEREPAEVRYHRRPPAPEIVRRLRNQAGLVIREQGGEVAVGG